MLTQIRKIMNGGSTPASPAVAGDGPTLSIIVILYDMPLQAEKTLYSLSPQYQQDVAESDYEVIVVENESANNLDRKFVTGLPRNFSYHLRAEREPTPVHAINHGVGISRGRHVCVMIDGARMVTPGVVRNILRGHRLSAKAVVSVPGYHIGDQLQQEAVAEGYGVAEDEALIESSGWPANGYGLFDIACFSGSCAAGFFRPNSESNCISIPRDIWAALGGMDTRFNLRGGGLVNLDLYKRACEFPGVEHVVLLGEGTFHQFHGGVTTGGEAREVRAALIEDMQRQYEHIRDEPYKSPQTRPVFLGELPRQVLKFVHSSAEPLLAAPSHSAPPAPVALFKAESASG
ncbi:glycosyltransferase [Seongchinamella sediminis]|uniref:Glycosyltransferase n=1 Tax=Seongchinamella sediminis TaxID=2283635 RepID=A0A3L7DV24_9GAMM|nr:glycosyltransferase [Seongchinamella sediminis]RLQ20635.1 glycosyltransferase [Seongchinamella sediminis]